MSMPVREAIAIAVKSSFNGFTSTIFAYSFPVFEPELALESQNMISMGTAVGRTANLEPRTYGPASLLNHMLVAKVRSASAPM
jgi:hypothetical protein